MRCRFFCVKKGAFMLKKIFVSAVLFIAACVYADAESSVKFTYPEWKFKALSFSYDDANIADRKLVGIFNKYGMKATFHIPSAWLKTKPKNRITEAEINTLYQGHEVSGHGANHLVLAKLSAEKVENEIQSDITEWKRITGRKITGYAYPYGSYSKKVIEILKKNGLIYSRTTGRAGNFDLPKDFLAWHANSHHNGKIAELGKKYLECKPEKMSVLLIWGHSYEFPRHKNWHVIENFCQQMCKKDDIYYAAMGEIASYAEACKKVIVSKDGKTLENKSDMTIFFMLNGKNMKVDAGKTVTVK